MRPRFAAEAADRGADSTVPVAIAVAARSARSLDEAGLALVVGITRALDLESAYLYVLEHRDAPCLRLVAHKGEHSAFVTDTPTITLDTDLRVVKVVLERAAYYAADPHGLADSPEEESGVGRWRSAIGAQAEATLPLIARDRVIGALALSWRTPRRFTDVDRRDLELLADACAPVVDRFRGAPHGSPARQGRRLSALHTADRDGRLIEGVGGPGAALRIAVATADVAGSGSAAFHMVARCGDGRTAVALGVVRTAEGAAEARAIEAKRLLAGWLGHGLEPAAALDALASWTAEHAAEVAGVRALTGIVDPARRYATFAACGDGIAAVLAGDGRLLLHAIAGETASAEKAADRSVVLLPGDRLALWSGEVFGTGETDVATVLRAALTGASGTAGSPARALLDAGQDADSAGAAVVLDVLGA